MRIHGVEALTLNDSGDETAPRDPAAWNDWVAATKTRNWVIDNPLLDWLRLYGESKGFIRDDLLPGYDPRCDFTAFIFEQGRRFESAVVDYLRSRFDVRTIAREVVDVRSLEKAVETVDAMRDGAPIIYQGVLRDPEHRVYGSPDLIVRSDVLAEMFPWTLGLESPTTPAQGIGADAYHYRIVDVKFTTLHLSAKDDLANDPSLPAYKIQLHLYERALRRIQGTGPLAAYLLGRRWEQTKNRKEYRGSSALDRLACFPAGGTLAHGKSTEATADQACEWIRRVRHEGHTWEVLPKPSIPELYPNLGNPRDSPWHAAQGSIADALEDVTKLWYVGLPGRERAHEAGVFRWTDPRCTPEVVGVGGKRGPTLSALIDVNRSTDGPVVRPERVRAAEASWRPTPRLEFYVDFETVSNLADDFSTFPEIGGQPLIFVIGCGHVEDGAWVFEQFLADEISEPAERVMVDRWLAHMRDVAGRLEPDSPATLVHWSHAEESTFEKAYNAAQKRHPEASWPDLPWFDLLKRVFQAEPVVVRGAMGFGLKDVARALHAHGLIETLWADSSLDGLGAMMGGWSCYREARENGRSVDTIDLMQEILRYNEVDCRVLMEVLRYLRESH